MPNAFASGVVPRIVNFGSIGVAVAGVGSGGRWCHGRGHYFHGRGAAGQGHHPRKLGATSLGEFQAAWAISMTYVGYVVTAMATDYFPRLAATVHDREAANRLINEQLEVALLGAGPSSWACWHWPRGW